ncbi:MAG TPA: alpha/beta fold hydrolase [Deltaproteobacteria bacterium]|nr:alpha/beta fold hydrolase [Deltaproteobacteria bacterium]
MKRFILLLSAILISMLACGCASVQESMCDAAIRTERMISGLEPGSVTIQGKTITYLERPGEGETVVLVHGFGADKDNWLRFVRGIPKEYRVIAMDLPGHGESFKDTTVTYTVDYMMNGFSQACDALKLDRFHYAGNSMGGWVGMLYAARNPDRVITLGLFDTAGINSPEPSDMMKALERGETILVPTTEEAFATLLGYAFHKEPFLPWPIRPVLARRAVEQAAFRQKLWNDVRSDYRDASPMLPELKLPVLVLWGGRDRITHVSSTQILERYLPDSRTVIMQDCGHMPMLERPREAAAHYLSFLSSHRDKARP